MGNTPQGKTIDSELRAKLRTIEYHSKDTDEKIDKLVALISAHDKQIIANIAYMGGLLESDVAKWAYSRGRLYA